MRAYKFQVRPYISVMHGFYITDYIYIYIYICKRAVTCLLSCLPSFPPLFPIVGRQVLSMLLMGWPRPAVLWAIAALAGLQNGIVTNVGSVV